MTDADADQVLRELLAKAARPVLADWGLEEQTNALVEVLTALFRNGYNIDALREILHLISRDGVFDQRADE